ncbi:MAG: lysophospholipid acyltransferase family protein [Deltaproteobacteria bacterium]|nr:lysophospholipid acyltransferase family protein [Deltaproteobacteria bacterium]
MARWTVGQRLKNDAIYRVIRATLAVARRLPLPLAGALGALAGRLGAWIARSESRRAEEACARSLGLGQPEARALARAAFASLGRSALELCSALDRPDALLGRVSFSPEDRARLDAALAERRGVVFVTAHLGSWELMAWALASMGYPIHTIAAPSYDPRLTRLLRRLRRERGVRSIWRSAPSAARRTLSVLRSGEILGALIDQSTRVPSVDVDFFGRPAPTPSGAAALALRTGAEVVAGFLTRRADRYDLRIRRLAVTRRGRDDVTANTARMTRAIEEAIRGAPDQWVWMHRRWERR